MSAALDAFDDQVFAALVACRAPRQSYVIRNYLVLPINVKRASIPVAKVLRSLKRLEVAGKVKRDTPKADPGYQYIWTIAQTAKENSPASNTA